MPTPTDTTPAPSMIRPIQNTRPPTINPGTPPAQIPAAPPAQAQGAVNVVTPGGGANIKRYKITLQSPAAGTPPVSKVYTIQVGIPADVTVQAYCAAFHPGAAIVSAVAEG